MKTFAMKLYLSICTLCFLCTACGVQFQEVNLYEGVEAEVQEPRPERVSQAVEPVIFQEDASNFWLPEGLPCTTGGVDTEVKRTGKNALKIEWDRDPSKCEWAGFGIGWDNWAGKDLSSVFEYAAIQMYARTTAGKMFGLPVVLTLEDYSGNMAWSYVGSSYFERYYLDEEWQKIEIPLNTFDLNEDGLDITNVKQLMFELQQSGGVYLDDIQLVYYEPKPKEIWLPGADTAPTVSYPVQLFDDGFINDNGWGVFQDDCQDIQLTSSTKSEGQRAIHAVWDSSKEDCYQVKMGVSWTKWFPTDITATKDNMILSFDLKGSPDLLTNNSLRFGLEDYERGTSFVTLSSTHFEEGTLVPNQWQQVKISLAELPAGVNFSDIKQLMIMMDNSGEVYLDNIRLEVTSS